MGENAMLGILLRGLRPKQVTPSTKSEARQESEETRQDAGIHLLRIEGGEVIAIKNPVGIPDAIDDFAQLTPAIPPVFVEALTQDFGFHKPTAVQRQAIALGLEGRSFLASAPTGSGKTMAFLIPILHHLLKAAAHPKAMCRALVLAPTKELAAQTLKHFKMLTEGRSTLTSALLTRECKAAEKVAVAVCTPGLSYLLDKQPRLLKYTEVLVFDEVDALMGTSFEQHSDKILQHCKSRKKIIMMFSATLPPRILSYADALIPNALVVRVGTYNSAPADIEQQLVDVNNETGKLVILKQMIEESELVPPALLFVQDKLRARDLHAKLEGWGLKAGLLHADMSTEERQSTLQLFRRGTLWFLVCTDVLARGIDCYGVRLVLNYDFPTSRESYIHRIGRTGRAGMKGKAVTFYTEADTPHLRIVVSVMKQSNIEISDEMSKMAKKIRDAARLVKNPVKRKPIAYIDREKKRAKPVDCLEGRQ